MISAIFDLDIVKILSLFSLSRGSRFNRKEVKEKTKLNNIPLDRALAKLAKTGIIKKEGNFYSIDFLNENSNSIMGITSNQYKSLKELPFDIYLLILDMVDLLAINKDIEVYLFGSYSKLIYSQKSDVDIAILDGKKKFNFGKLEEKYKKNIEVHFFSKKSFYKNKKDPLVKDIIKNGMRLL